MNNEQTFDETSRRYAQCYDNLSQARTVLMSFDDVIGVGIGPKQRDGKLDTSEVCFLVYVETKRPASELEAKAFIPKEFAGVMIDVVEIGRRRLDVHNQFDARWLKQSTTDCLSNVSGDEAERLAV